VLGTESRHPPHLRRLDTRGSDYLRSRTPGPLISDVPRVVPSTDFESRDRSSSLPQGGRTGARFSHFSPQQASVARS
jgi:hypothetical protein